MKGRGGPGRGQGRKPDLTPAQCIEVGATYQRVWDEARKIEAYAIYYSDEKNWALDKKIGELQEANRKSLAAQRDAIKLRKAKRISPKHFEHHVKGLEQSRERRSKKLDQIGRRLSLQVNNIKKRRDIVTDVTIDWCKKKLGIKITSRLVAECRAKYRRVEKKLRNYWPD